MSGLVGSFVFDCTDFRVTEKYLSPLLERLAHRGADCATWIAPDAKVGLGQLGRSSVARGPSAATAVLCDGVVYNRTEIERDLERLDIAARTDWTAGELIAAAFEAWGQDCLTRLVGVFACAIWDASRRELWLVRDRVGIKPLYYSLHNGRVVFASEIKALLADPDQRVAVNEAGVVQYLTFLATPGPETLFQGIAKLPPRTGLRIEASGQVSAKPYWDVLENAQLLVGRPESELYERTYDAVERAVARCLTGGGEVGAFLSSGSDASAVFALMARLADRPVQAFTYGYGGKGDTDKPGETAMARRIAEGNGGHYNECLITPEDMRDTFAKVVYHQDEPIADPLCIMFYFAAKLAAESGVRHVQTGMGADELYFGYPNWRRWAKLDRITSKLPDMAVVVLARCLLPGLDRTSFRYERALRAARGEPITWSGDELFTAGQKAEVLSPRLAFLDREVCVAPVRACLEKFRAKAAEPSQLNWMTYHDLAIRIPEWLMMRGDKMSTAFGVECRNPLLDHELIELAMSIPTEQRFGDGTLKYLFLKSTRDLIRDDLVTRDDGGVRGFPYITFVRTIRDAWSNDIKSFCEESGLVSYPGVMKLMDTVQSPKEMHQARQVLGLIILATWWKVYIKKDDGVSR